MKDKKSRKLTLFLILDAFRWDYLDPEVTPFMYKASKEHLYVKKLKSSKGFTQRSTIMTGVWPETHGKFTMYNYSPDISQYSFLRVIPDRLLRLVERFNKSDRGVRKFLNIYNKKRDFDRRFSTAYIPLELLQHTGITEDNIPIYTPRVYYPLESLFDKFAEKGVEYKFIMFPRSDADDQGVFNELLQLGEEDVDVVFAQFSDSDAKIHKAGVQTEGARAILNEVDTRVERIYDTISEQFEQFEIILVGDHGMTEVKSTFNVDHLIRDTLKKKGLKFGRDYFTFHSSTLVHFWWKDRKGMDAIIDLVESEEFTQNGFVIDKDIARKMRIPFNSREYGDLIWAANLGVLIYPDYFQKYEEYKAMHGYITDSGDMDGMALIISNRSGNPHSYEEADIVDICSTIAYSVGVDAPSTAVGKHLQK